MFFFSFSNNIISEIEIKVKFYGASGQNRTDDPRITSAVLCLLSYRGIRSGTHLRISRRPFSGWVGWANWARTSDLLINSQPLYLLSYSPMLIGCGERTRTSDLQVMGLASCQLLYPAI